MNYTLVTGASRGIGASIAAYCASKKYNLVLVARSEERLNEIASQLQKEYDVDIKILVLDLTAPSACEYIVQWCISNKINVNMLINNVGVGSYGKFAELPLTSQLDLIQLNQLVAISLTHLFIPLLEKNSKSYILNVASTASYQPIPYMSVYAGTQSFLLSFSLALREELLSKKIVVSCLCPGPTATDFFDKAGLENLPVNSSELKMSSSEVAEVAIEGMLDNVAEIVPGTSNTIGAYFSKIFPNKWIVKTVSALFSPKS